MYALNPKPQTRSAHDASSSAQVWGLTPTQKHRQTDRQTQRHTYTHTPEAETRKKQSGPDYRTHSHGPPNPKPEIRGLLPKAQD